MGKVAEARIEGRPVSDVGILRRRKTGPFRGPRKHLALQTRLTVAWGGGQEYLLGRRKVNNGNSRSTLPAEFRAALIKRFPGYGDYGV